MMDILSLSFDAVLDLPVLHDAAGNIDPCSPLQRWMAWNVWLPELERGMSGNTGIAFNSALRMVAEHDLPMPDWLRTATLQRIPAQERKKLIDRETVAQAMRELMDSDEPDLFDMELRIGISQSQLRRMRKEELARLARLEKAIDA